MTKNPLVWLSTHKNKCISSKKKEKKENCYISFHFDFFIEKTTGVTTLRLTFRDIIDGK